MDDRQDNGKPPAPEGMGSPSMQLAPYEGGTRQRVASPTQGLVWCACGALLGFIVPLLTAYFAAMGAAMLSGRGTSALRSAVAPCLLCAAGLLFGAAPADVLMGVAAYLAGIVMGAVVARRGTSVTAELLLAVVLALALIAVDTWRALGLGTTIEAVLAGELDTMVELYEQQVGISASAAIEQVRDVVMLLWPMSYFVLAAAYAACAHLGARSGLRRIGADSPRLPLAFFDTPLWVVGALATSVLLVAFAGLLGERGTLPLMVGLNVLAIVRIVLALDGLGVIAFYLVGMRAGRLTLAIVLAIAVNIEISLPIVSGLGLIDFWANFRHLVRGVVPADEPQG